MKVGKMNIDKLNNELFHLVQSSEISEDVLDSLIPDGEPHSFEGNLWDYKRKSPSLSERPSDAERTLFTYQIHEMIKDIISFHNAYGGYILFGVEDKGTEKLIGCTNELDCGDLKKRIKACTKRDVDIFFKTMSLEKYDRPNKKIGVLLISRRRRHTDPVKFVKAGPRNSKNKRPYQKDKVYVRINDECRPADSTHEDWKFLFSDRIFDRKKSVSNKSISNNLPARDPDLVEFVGREIELAALRNWHFDKRSPIRLLTGIGGLGKTSIAYQFSEEVIDAAIADFDLVVWVTAKKVTYAALMGKMVRTTRHDFSNLKELLLKLVSIIAGESSADEDLDAEELVETLVDALEYQPCFIVVDDVDSLAPDDQRECVAVLQSIALRTVDRDYSSSRILVTSRLSQGLSPTSIIKVNGLPIEPFSEHIKNLCKQFDMKTFSKLLIKKIHVTTSGSPLFASAIVRLAFMGENPKDLCEVWKVLESIGELQSFHLVSKSENSYGEQVFSSSKELISVIEILQKKLGHRGRIVDAECAKIRKNVGDKNRKIGVDIKKIVNYWGEGMFDEALIIAKELSRRNPKNGDVWCALSGANLKVNPSKFVDADKAANKAIEHKCNRVELFDYVVKAKIGIEDWIGLQNYVGNRAVRSASRDKALDTYIYATEKLIDLSFNRQDYIGSAKYAFEIIEKIALKIQGDKLMPDYFKDLAILQDKHAANYVKYMMRENSRAADQLDVANAIFNLIDMNVLRNDLTAKACVALSEWFTDVENRRVVDFSALDILKDKIRNLRRVENLLRHKGDKYESAVTKVESTISDLEYRGANMRMLQS